MPNYDVKCDKCGRSGTELIKISERDTWQREHAECGGTVRRCVVPSRAPAVHFDANDYDTQIRKLKQSCNEHFVKSGEMDQVRHEHGSAFDDSLVYAATDRIKSGNATNN